MLASCCGTGTGTATGTGSDTGFSAGVVVGGGSGAVTGLAVTKGAGAVGAVATVTGSAGLIGEIAAIGGGSGVGVGVGVPAAGAVGRLRAAEACLTTGALSGTAARLAPSSITRVFKAETCSGTGRVLSGCSRYPCPMATTAQSTASVYQFGRPLGAPLSPGDGECRSCDMFI